jgi:hypothetical protein
MEIDSSLRLPISSTGLDTRCKTPGYCTFHQTSHSVLGLHCLFAGAYFIRCLFPIYHRDTVQNSYYLRSWTKLRDPGQTVVDVTRPGAPIQNLVTMNMMYDGVRLCTLVTVVGSKLALLCYQNLVLDSDKQELAGKSVTRSHHDRQ